MVLTLRPAPFTYVDLSNAEPTDHLKVTVTGEKVLWFKPITIKERRLLRPSKEPFLVLDRERTDMLTLPGLEKKLRFQYEHNYRGPSCDFDTFCSETIVFLGEGRVRAAFFREYGEKIEEAVGFVTIGEALLLDFSNAYFSAGNWAEAGIVTGIEVVSTA